MISSSSVKPSSRDRPVELNGRITLMYLGRKCKLPTDLVSVELGLKTKTVFLQTAAEQRTLHLAGTSPRPNHTAGCFGLG